MKPSCGVSDESLWDILDEVATPSGDFAAHVAACDACAQRLEELRRLHVDLEAACGTEPMPLPEAIGRYRVVRAIGEGGMGVVYEAEQPQPLRRVALKLMRPVCTTDEHNLRAFQREIRALARLRRTGLVTIFDAGRTEEGRLYFVMELVDGVLIDDYCKRGDLDLRERVELAVQLTDAVEHAHGRGVLHRDLKPANVLVDAEGTPRVLDFGLARFLRPGDGVTESLHGPVGTLPYMSSEQLRAPEIEVDARTDVYSLGVILYQLLTDRLPHVITGGLADALRTLSERTPPTPTSLAPHVPRELGAVVMRAIAEDREQRYGSARALADDLRRYLAGDAVVARPPLLGYRLGSLLRHKRVSLVAGAMVAVSAAIVLALAFRGDRASAASPPVRLVFEPPASSPHGIVRQFDFARRGLELTYATDGRVYLRDSARETNRALVESAGGWRYRTPRWSPDDTAIAMIGRRYRRSGSKSEREDWLFVWTAGDARLSRVAAAGSNAGDLCWTRDASALTFVRDRRGVATVGLDGVTRWQRPVPGVAALGGYSSAGAGCSSGPGPSNGMSG